MEPNDPRMANVECLNAQHDYESGKDGIQIAEEWITVSVVALLTVREARAKNPQTFPGYGEATPEAVARRIVARLIDAGWRPADAECLELPQQPTDHTI